MKGRPLLSFTICWLCGSGIACALTGWALIWGLIGGSGMFATFTSFYGCAWMVCFIFTRCLYWRRYTLGVE